ncbi:unnamed protein product (macronuclear) [Paramecium tetraurelia]|uniref:Uncharacterized protein n=1 Tax=Paramecium tetraurelia TaxID=5888 RepID=A0EIP2_PARTE|nr:uncharacterized protein GSPATT00027512001 [Paramecium tetraurelia]CAK95183.1 unnamed protein product [Paramecium tetraurelia]|eukprot:XP_001462556.1 hypothetical protein (macronuclear) [Paramecium tetraurelia strain d4-2]
MNQIYFYNLRTSIRKLGWEDLVAKNQTEKLNEFVAQVVFMKYQIE